MELPAFPTYELLEQRALEHYIQDLVDHNCHAEVLPDNLEGGGFEAYANWLGVHSQDDPRHFERGSVVHRNMRNNRLLFPLNPTVGDDMSVSTLRARNREVIAPVLHLHTHPDDMCFSTVDAQAAHAGDLGVFMAGEGTENHVDHFVPAGMIVAAPTRNYLLLRTDQTPTVRLSDFYRTVLEHRNSRGARPFFAALWQIAASAAGQLIPNGPERVRLVNSLMLHDYLGIGFHYYARDFEESLFVAGMYGAGLYMSHKDGNYQQLTRERVDALLQEELEAAVRHAACVG